MAYAGGLQSRYTSSATSLVHVRKFLNAFKASGFGGVFIWSEDVPRGQEGKLSRSQIGHRARASSSELTELNTGVRAIEVRAARLPEQVLVFSGVEAPAKK